MIKKYYSAFTDTSLVDILKNTDEVRICDLMTNVCIHATAADAFFHGHRVYVWTDCLAYRTKKRHSEAIEHMRRWYATMISSGKYLQQAQAASKPTLTL